MHIASYWDTITACVSSKPDLHMICTSATDSFGELHTMISKLMSIVTLYARVKLFMACITPKRFSRFACCYD